MVLEIIHPIVPGIDKQIHQSTRYENFDFFCTELTREIFLIHTAQATNLLLGV